MPQEMEAEQRLFSIPAALANDLMGMGSWRLRSTIDPSIQFLVSRLEGSWRELLRDGEEHSVMRGNRDSIGEGGGRFMKGKGGALCSPYSPLYPPLSVCLADLNLYPASEWKAQGWDWCDSMDPERELDGFSDGDIPSPAKGEEG
jgi:hypothetical protein